VESQQGVVLQLGGWAMCYQLLTVETGLVTKWVQMPQAWTDPLVHSKQWKRDMRFSTWNVRSLFRSRSLIIVARGLARHKLDFVCVQEVRWEKGDTIRAEDYIFFYGKGSETHQLETGFFFHHKILSAVKRVECVSDRMSYIVLRGC
jgi:hypothetical protein